MQVLLLVDVKRVGRRGQVVEVADGYGSNVLIPRKQAILATERVLLQKQAEAAKQARAMVAKDAEMRTLVSRLQSKPPVISVLASPDGTLYEAVRAEGIAGAIRREGLHLSPLEISLPKPIKEIGLHQIFIGPAKKFSFEIEIKRK